MDVEKKPLLSVCLITYNHAPFIRQAVDSILMQQTDFYWELIIADDCSTDGTTKIVQEYALNNPGKIKTILQAKNVGAAKNWMQLITTPKTKYIAYFEGDDYWTDPLKLQKQVDYLERNQDCSICYHRVNILSVNELEPETLNSSENSRVFTINDLLSGNIMHTPSVVFRNQYDFENLGWLSKCKIGDYPLHCYNALKGYVYYMPDIMAVYRTNPNSTFFPLAHTQKYQKLIATLDVMAQHLPVTEDQKGILIKRRNEFIHILLNETYKEGFHWQTFKLWIKYLNVSLSTSLRWFKIRISNPKIKTVTIG